MLGNTWGLMSLGLTLSNMYRSIFQFDLWSSGLHIQNKLVALWVNYTDNEQVHMWKQESIKQGEGNCTAGVFNK